MCVFRIVQLDFALVLEWVQTTDVGSFRGVMVAIVRLISAAAAAAETLLFGPTGNLIIISGSLPPLPLYLFSNWNSHHLSKSSETKKKNNQMLIQSLVLLWVLRARIHYLWSNTCGRLQPDGLLSSWLTIPLFIRWMCFKSLLIKWNSIVKKKTKNRFIPV